MLFLVELNADILVSFTLPFIEECHSNLMVQSLTYRSDIHSNVGFVALPAKCAGCFSSAHAYIHNSGLNSCQVPGVRSALVAREEESDTWFMPLIWILE